MSCCATEEILCELRSVLLVEDEYFLAADLEDALTGAGFATDVVSSGEEALTLFAGGGRSITGCWLPIFVCTAA